MNVIDKTLPYLNLMIAINHHAVMNCTIPETIEKSAQIPSQNTTGIKRIESERRKN